MPWLTIYEAAELYGCHPFSVKRMAAQGKIVAVKGYYRRANAKHGARYWLIEPGSLYEHMQHRYDKSRYNARRKRIPNA